MSLSTAEPLHVSQPQTPSNAMSLVEHVVRLMNDVLALDGRVTGCLQRVAALERRMEQLDGRTQMLMCDV